MVVKIYISGISGNKEVKKRQQRVSMILDSKHIKYDLIDIAEPGNETDKDYMQAHSTAVGATIGDANPKYPLPPQIYNGADYCGDYEQFDIFNENDELDQFLKLTPADLTVTSSVEVHLKTLETLQKAAELVPESDVNNAEGKATVKNGANDIDTDKVENGDSAQETGEKKNEEPDNVGNGEDADDN